MTLAAAQLAVNPFEDDIVREPRDVSFSVPGLNDAPLDQLVRAFARLERGDPPRRPVTADKAQMVVSPDRGYGKSHLIGRLFARLVDRAITVYLRPFQDPFKPWHSILLTTVQELERPAEAIDPTEEIGTAYAGLPSQLEAMALGTLAHVAADFLAEGGIPDYPAEPAIVFLHKLADEAATTAKPDRAWLDWLAWLIGDSGHIGRLAGLFRRRGIDLGGREAAWLKVLGTHVYAEPFDARREAALKWLRAEPLEPDDLDRLGLTAADDEGRGEASAQEINDLSFRRLQGLCRLSSYFRPFLFCFDQTEFYASDPALVRALGNCIDQLFVDLPNQLTVITANHENWVTEILPLIAKPQHNRISPEIRLEGIRIAGARELIGRRLADYEIDCTVLARMLADDWLGTVFDPLPEIGVRDLLMRAAERFRRLADGPPPARHTLADLFKLQVNDVRSKKALLAYNQDALMWFVKEVGQGLSDAKVGRLDARRYFSIEWALPDRSVCFAFEGGDHWHRWGAIATEAHEMAASGHERTVLTYVFRTPELPKVPKRTWLRSSETIERAKSRGFHIIALTLEEVCEINAARELYSNALQGNIDFSGKQTLAWLREHFSPFLKGLAFREAPPKDAPDADGNGGTDNRPIEPTLIEADLGIVLTVVRTQKIVDIRVVLQAIGGEDKRDPLLRSVEKHPNLKAHPGPQTTFLQWRTGP
ncbi:hypothetical protein A33M_3468 [Rhodovulum sp. PH10]|uniref:hypothetical protein n=1 Tax=Rhodovulum sp. PH10 TaxID=1187851 RepID=UPI00027C2C55|nr:hypothetical protein [Rhodovulum sp. PH10]EJW11114.1 hypothetical protein A33M_3468 [Rhodovulum sp. PH10]